MDLQAIVSQIEFRIGNKKHLSAQIVTEIELAQKSLERDPKLNLYFLFRSWAFQAFVDDRAYPMPGDFVKLCDVNQPYYIDSTNTVYRLKRRVADAVFVPGQVGIPQYYAFQNNSFITDKLVDGVYRIFYYGMDTTLSLTGVTENNWTRLAPNVIMLKAAINIAKTLRDFELMNALNAEYQIEYQNLFDLCVAMEDVGHDISRGEFTDAY